jgi:DNA-binding GntR family transcriptional regulator
MRKVSTQRKDTRRGTHEEHTAPARLSRRSGRRTGSLADAAYERIKGRIISLQYPPGAYVNEAQLCSDLTLGRTPVHHAVMRLAHDGLLEIVPRKGIIVSPVSLQDVMACLEVRLLNEQASARMAAERAGAEELAGLAACLKRSEQMVAARNITGLMNVDREFHGLVARASRNRMLEQILQRLHEQSLRFWFIGLRDPARLQIVDSEHREILQALQARDPALAEAAMRSHIESFREYIRDSL